MMTISSTATLAKCKEACRTQGCTAYEYLSTTCKLFLTGAIQVVGDGRSILGQCYGDAWVYDGTCKTPASVIGQPDIAPPDAMRSNEANIAFDSIAKCKAACLAKGSLCGAYAYNHF